MNPVILASGSPRRKKLLEQINLPFQIQVSSVDEHYKDTLTPPEIVQTLARRKAVDVAQQFDRTLIIGADTIVVYQGAILKKPSSKEAAQTMLRQLSGDTHSVLTGVALCKCSPSNDLQTHLLFEETLVTFGDLHPRDIEKYVDSESPMDKAGAYGIQDDYGALFVKRIEGDYNTVVGFPLYAFYQAMQDFAPEYLSH